MATATGTEWQQARQWLLEARVIPPNHPATKPSAQLIDFANCLRDGVFLCDLLNKLIPSSVPHYHPRATLQFKCVQNINAFLMSCHRDFGVPQTDLFQAPHLYDVSDFGQVVRCLSALSKTAPALAAGLIPFPEAASTGYSEEDIYGNLENIAMNTNLSKVSSFNRATSGHYDVESIYDIVPTAVEEDIYGELVTLQQKLRPAAGSGFAGLPEKLGHVVAELVETEKSYVTALQMLSQHYIQALALKLDPDVRRTIFINLEDLLEIHTRFLADLEKQLDSTKMFSQCFITHADAFVSYGTYCANLPAAQLKVQDLLNRPGTAQLLETCKRNSQNRFTLKDLLSVPMQRILKYPLILREMLKQATKCDYHDLGGLDKANDCMVDVATCVNEIKRDIERIQSTQDIQQSLEGYKEDLLTLHGRSLVDGEVKIKLLAEEGKGKTRYALVLDKALFICRSKGNDKYQFKMLMKLEDFRVEDMPTPNTKGKFQAAFQMQGIAARSTAGQSCVIYCKTAQEKNEFMETLQMCMHNINPTGSSELGHRYEWSTFDDRQQKCAVCNRLMWGLILQGYHCSACHSSVHRNCLSAQSSRCRNASTRASVSRVLPATPTTQVPVTGGIYALSLRSYNGVPHPPRGLQPLLFGLQETIELSSMAGDWWEGTLARTRQSGVFPASFVSLREEEVAPPLSLKEKRELFRRYPWFAGKMSRAEAEQQLLHSMNGTYMIRESEAHPGDFALSIKFHQPKHIRVVIKDDQYYLSQSKVFPTLMQLVEHYQTNTLNVSFPGLDTTLVWAFNDTVGRCIANFHFSARDGDELTIDEQIEVKILSKETTKSGWWYGQCRGRFGLFPSNYVTELM